MNQIFQIKFYPFNFIFSTTFFKLIWHKSNSFTFVEIFSLTFAFIKTIKIETSNEIMNTNKCDENRNNYEIDPISAHCPTSFTICEASAL